MLRAATRAAAVALFGAMAGALCLTIAFGRQPGLDLDMDRDLPPVVSGLYPPERVDDLTFAWTAGRTQVALDGADRRVAWVCRARLRGGRAAPLPQPTVDVAIDGIRAASVTASNDYQEVEVTAPPRERDGLVLTLIAAPTVVPGPQDRRELGVQIDRLGCSPGGDEIALPPRRTMLHASVAAAAFGAMLALLDITAVAAVGATILIAAAQALLLGTGAAPFGGYSAHALRLAAAISVGMFLCSFLIERVTARRLRNTARFVVAFAAAVLYLKLLGLLHPSKMLIDAVFQAHRLEWVLGGRYYFTQPMPGGVQFPYAIGLYVVAAPWSLLTKDYVTLLRVVVCVTEAAAGALLYPAIVRVRGDRLEGAVAAALFGLVPMAFLFTGNANLTNVFGQSVACMAVVAAVLLALQSGRPRGVVALTAVTAVAFLSHVSTFAILTVTLVVLAALYHWRGGPALRSPARRVLAATAVAALLSVALYYGHFTEVYQRALRVRATATSTQVPATAPAPAAPQNIPTLAGRTVEAMRLTVQAVGWPLLLLAALGVRPFWRGGSRDRLACAVGAWSVACLVFLSVGLMRVDPQYQRYSFEFVGRVAFATYPAAAVLGGYGAVWAWRAGRVARIASAGLLLSAIIVGARSWLRWLQ